MAADKTCFDLSDVALNMLPVFELWMERCDKFEEARIKAERGNESPRGYKTYDGGFEALPPSVSAYEGWGVQPSKETNPFPPFFFLGSNPFSCFFFWFFLEGGSHLYRY